MSSERISKLESLGADVRRPDVNYDAAGDIMMKEAAVNDWTVISDQSFLPSSTWPDGYVEIPSLIVCGYTRLYQEALEQMEEPPTHVFVQAGVGGLIGAAILQMATESPGTRVVSVEPCNAACVLSNLSNKALTGSDLVMFSGSVDSVAAGLNCGIPSPSLWPVLLAGIDLAVAVGDDRFREAVKLMYFNSGGRVLAGDSGAAGLAGFLALVSGESEEGVRVAREIGLDKGSRVLVINSEGVTDREAFKVSTGVVDWKAE